MPWNELADSLSKDAARGGQSTQGVPQSIADLLSYSRHFEWLWLLNGDDDSFSYPLHEGMLGDKCFKVQSYQPRFLQRLAGSDDQK
eukprot:3354973-Karenia_brevis.AAC.1